MIEPSSIDVSSLPSVELENRSQLHELPCIYFCVTPSNTVVYIGETSNLYDRWSRYRHDKLRSCQSCGCDRIAWLSPVPEVRFYRLAIERALVKRFQPILNMQRWNGLRKHNPGKFYDSVLPGIHAEMKNLLLAQESSPKIESVLGVDFGVELED